MSFDKELDLTKDKCVLCKQPGDNFHNIHINCLDETLISLSDCQAKMNKESEVLDFFESDKFKDEFEVIFKGRSDSYFNRNRILYHLKEWFRSDYRTTVKAEETAKRIYEEARRMLMTVFYVVDTIRDGTTHNEKNAYTRTALQIIRKQIEFFRRMQDEKQVQDFFENSRWSGWAITNFYDMQKKLESKMNTIKQLQGENQQLQEMLNKE